MLCVDVNVLVYAANSECEQSGQARAWLEAALAGPEFELRIVSARGTVVWPKMSPAFDHPGFFRSRFVARDPSKAVTDEALAALVARVAGVAPWFHIEKLRSWNGEEGFSRAQGE